MSLMNKQHIERQELARKYIRGELSEQEAEEFEIYLLDKPEMIEELELDEVFHNCLDEAEEKRVERFSIWKWVTQTPVGASIATFACTGILGIGLLLTIPIAQIQDEAPVTSSEILFLETVRSNNQMIPQISLSTSGDFVSLFLQLDSSSASSTDLSIKTAAGAHVYALQGVITNGELVVTLPISGVKQGDYILTTLNKDTDKVQTFTFRVIE